MSVDMVIANQIWHGPYQLCAEAGHGLRPCRVGLVVGWFTATAWGLDVWVTNQDIPM